MEERDGKPQFIIQQVSDLEQWLETKPVQQPILYLKIAGDKQDEKSLQQINQLLKENRGEARRDFAL